MYDDLIFSLKPVLPMIVWMGLGVVLRTSMRLDERWRESANRLVFYLFLPLLLFHNMLESDLRSELSARTLMLLGYAFLATMSLFALLMLVVPRFEPVRERRGVIIQGIFRSNAALFGVVLALAIYGEGRIGVMVIAMGVLIPVYNVLSTFVLEFHAGKGGGWGRLLWKVATNGLVVATLAGLAFNLSGLHMPDVAGRILWPLADMGMPFSFLVLGAGLDLSSVKGNRKTLAVVTLCKLVLYAVAMLGGGILLGFRDIELVALLALSATPTAVGSYSMVAMLGGDLALSSEIVLTTALCAPATLFLFVWALRSLALI